MAIALLGRPAQSIGEIPARSPDQKERHDPGQVVDRRQAVLFPGNVPEAEEREAQRRRGEPQAIPNSTATSAIGTA